MHVMSSILMFGKEIWGSALYSYFMNMDHNMDYKMVSSKKYFYQLNLCREF